MLGAWFWIYNTVLIYKMPDAGPGKLPGRMDGEERHYQNEEDKSKMFKVCVENRKSLRENLFFLHHHWLAQPGSRG